MLATLTTVNNLKFTINSPVNTCKSLQIFIRNTTTTVKISREWITLL